MTATYVPTFGMAHVDAPLHDVTREPLERQWATLMYRFAELCERQGVTLEGMPLLTMSPSAEGVGCVLPLRLRIAANVVRA